MSAGGLATTLAVALGSSACAASGSVGPLAHPADLGSTLPSVAGSRPEPAPLHTMRSARRSAPDPSPRQANPLNPVPMSASTAIVQGWLSALQAVDEASYTSNWRSPDLAATEVDPELVLEVSDLHALARAGIVTRGTTTLVSVGVVSLSGDTAQLVGCVTRGEINVFASTGRPLPGASGRAGPEVISAEMIETSMSWKVKSETSKESPCPFA